MKKQNLLQLLYSIVILFLITYISSFIFFRFDLTSEKRYTLSDETKNILKNLDDTFYIEIYLDGEMPSGFHRLKNATKELLDEFRIYANENIQYKFVNPSENQDKKTRAEIYNQLYKNGITPINIQDIDDEGGKIEKIVFPGAMVFYQEREIPLNLLKNDITKIPEENLNNSIQSLEYELINIMHKNMQDKIKKIAFIEGHGELDEHETGDIMQLLSEHYKIERLTMNGQLRALKDYEVIIIAKPDTFFNEKDKFIIDQYLMHGGKILWLIDAVHANLDSLATQSSMIALAYENINLNDQLFKYGVRINYNLIQDIQASLIPINTAIIGSPPQWKPAPWFYFPLLNSSSNHVITKYMNLVKSEFISTLDTVGNNPNIKKTILLSSSKYSKIVNTPVRISLDILRQKINPNFFNKSNLPVAVLLEGEFESIYKNRVPPALAEDNKIKFKESSIKTAQIVVSDGDIIKNIVKVNKNGKYQYLPLGTDRYYQEEFTQGNTEFLLNSINYLCDDKGLMSVRKRELTLRLLDKTKVKEERLKWQIINLVLPILAIIFFGILMTFLRKKQYAS